MNIKKKAFAPIYFDGLFSYDTRYEIYYGG